MILVDSCILIDVLGKSSQWRDWSLNAVRAALVVDTLAINPVIYGEAAVGWPNRDAFEDALSDFRTLPLSPAVAWRAARAHSEHLARGGKRRRILGDFWIGAHAEVERLTLLTRNPKDYARFQIPELIHP